MKTNFPAVSLILMLLTACTGNYYTLEDFQKVNKTDAHFHIYTGNNSSMEQALKDNFSFYTINTYSDGCERVVEAHEWLKEVKKQHPDKIAFSATFCLDGWDDPAWVDNTIAWIDRCLDEGATSVKIWKNIGMEFRDKDSILIMVDDPKFDPVFRHLAQKGIPVVGHLGEPKACWMPIEEMKANNNKNYFRENPQYHMYLHPDYPSYEEQMAARDRMLEKNPDLIFIGCHLASLEWDVDVLAGFLDRFPNASADMSARMGDLFYQTRDDREKVRNFFIRYQDRLMYGTDVTDRGGNREAFQKRLHDTWIRDWEYLVTDHKMTSNLIDGEFQGLKLPKEVIDKVYHTNVRKWYTYQQ